MNETPTSETDDPATIALVEERLSVEKREVERGRVIVRKRVETREAFAEASLRQEEVQVERVPIGIPVDEAPPIREEDGVLVVPVLEEQLVVSTRLILKEELRITRTSRTEQVREPVRLRVEQAEVTRLDGRPDDQQLRTEGGP
jgi:uncharacterized protein (TIGR02271 family)